MFGYDGMIASASVTAHAAPDCALRCLTPSVSSLTRQSGVAVTWAGSRPPQAPSLTTRSTCLPWRPDVGTIA